MNLTLPPRLRRLMPWVGYPLFYLLALLVFVRCTFPYDRVGQRLVATFNAAQAEGRGRRLELESTHGHWVFGVKAKGIRLVTPAKPDPEEEKPSLPQVVEWDRAHASVGLLGLLFGTTRVAFGALSGPGALAGRFVDRSEERRMAVEVEAMPLDSIPLLQDSAGIPMEGALTGSIDLAFPDQELGKAEGTIKLTVEGCQLGDGKAKIRGFIALPKLDAGRLELDAEATAGRLKVKTLKAKGNDFELEASGQIRLKNSIERSVAELTMKYRFTEAYMGRNDMTRGLFGDPKTQKGGLMDLDPKVKRAKGADGYYSWRVSGELGSLTFQPDSAGSTSSRVRRARSRRPGSDSEDDGAEDEAE